MKVETLVIQFRNAIAAYETPAFRGAVLAALEGRADILFHNHCGEGFRYAYPLIQYKRIGGKASLVCIGTGTEVIGQFFSQTNMEINIGERFEHLQIESVRPQRTLVQVWDHKFHYYLRNWLPFNSENYRLYIGMSGLIERAALLNKILIGNILSFAKGVGVNIDQPIFCEILNLGEPRNVRVKGKCVMSFDIEFSCNVSIPDYIGLGKHTSFGYGTICQKREKSKHTINNQEYESDNE